MRSDSNWDRLRSWYRYVTKGGVYSSESFIDTLRDVCGSERMIDTTIGGDFLSF